MQPSSTPDHTESSTYPPAQGPARFNDPYRPPPDDLKRFARLFMRDLSPPSDEQVESLRVALHRGDPLADSWTAYAHENLDRAEAKRWVELALFEGVHKLSKRSDAPAPLVELMRQIETQPLWLDPKLLDLAHLTFRRSAFIGDWVLIQVSLMGGYRHEGVIQPLLYTGRLREYAVKRMADTSQFLIHVTEKNGLKTGDVGYRAAVQVRLLHAHIRYYLNREESWSEADWGSPINQADLAGTNLLFSLSFLTASRIMGMRFTDKESQSIIHLWRYIGHLMGVEDALLPSNEEEARRIFYLVGMTQTPAGEEAATLGRALHEVPIQRATGRLSRLKARGEMRMRAGLSRFFLGDEAADHLGLPKTKLKYAPLGLIPLVNLYERVRAMVPGGTRFTAWWGGAWQLKNTQRQVGDLKTLYARGAEKTRSNS